MIQLSLFEPTILQTIYLIADSPRQAFYRLILTEYHGQIELRKEWGTVHKVLGYYIQPMNSCISAEK